MSPSVPETTLDGREGARPAPYLRSLTQFLHELARRAHVHTFEVTELFVAEPLAGDAAELRNGSSVPLRRAVELVRRMCEGHGPFCALGATGMRVECSWDGAVVLTLDPTVSPPDLDGWPHLRIRVREAPPAGSPEGDPVTAAADDAFWSAVASAPAQVKLLRERWAHGKFGARWYDVSGDTLLRRRPAVEPRSLISVLLDPQLDPGRMCLDGGFTALRRLGGFDPLVHEEFAFGIENPPDLRGHGWPFAVNESEAWEWLAVVPDGDGHVRGSWLLPGA